MKEADVTSGRGSYQSTDTKGARVTDTDTAQQARNRQQVIDYHPLAESKSEQPVKACWIDLFLTHNILMMKALQPSDAVLPRLAMPRMSSYLIIITRKYMIMMHRARRRDHH